MIRQYEGDGLKIKIMRPLISEVEKIERSKHIAKQLKNVVQEHSRRLDEQQDT